MNLPNLEKLRLTFISNATILSDRTVLVGDLKARMTADGTWEYHNGENFVTYTGEGMDPEADLRGLIDEMSTPAAELILAPFPLSL